MSVNPPPENAVTFDLGSDQPLSEMTIHSLYRPRAVSHQESIIVLASDNNVKSYYVTDIAQSDAVFTKVQKFHGRPQFGHEFFHGRL